MYRFRLASAVLATALFLPAAAAHAAPGDGTFHCSAAAISGTVLGQPLPATGVGSATAACTNAKAGLAQALPAPLTTSAVGAATIFKGTNETRQAVALGGIADLHVNALPDLGITLPVSQVTQNIPKISVPLPSTLTALGLPASIDIDINAAVQALLPNDKLPNVDLLSLGAVQSYAAAGCDAGQPKVTATSVVSDLKVLGQDLPVNELVNQTLNLLDTSNIDLSKLDLSKITLPAGLSLTTPVVGPLLQAVLSPVIKALPPIQIPATVAQIKVQPSVTKQTDTSAAARALSVSISIAGQSVAELAIGDAAVSVDGVDCSAVQDAPSATDLQLQCTDKKLVLVDVLTHGSQVALNGRADQSLAGQTVKIIFDATKKQVATAVIKSDGSFAATAPLPAKKLRSSSLARYRAVLGTLRSDNLKLQRRMVVNSMTASAGKVKIVGQVVPPLGKPLQKVQVQQRVSCTKNKIVATVTPSKTGKFTVSVPAPSGVSAAVYRVITKVRNNTKSNKLFSTYTLPRAIDL